MKCSVSDVLLDIEGTTCPVDFVANTLFPYARDHITVFIQQHGREADVAALLTEAETAWNADHDPAAVTLRQACKSVEETDHASCIAGYLRHLIRVDRKLPALKELQGMIWAEAYADGKLRAPLFPDVATALTAWRDAGLRLSVYSSGSVSAQKMVYRYSTAGDLRTLFHGWFDTRIGSKTEPRSYLNIADALEIRPAQALFISDSLPELNAASSAGLQVCFSDREGNPQRDPGRHPSISRLDQVQPLPVAG